MAKTKSSKSAKMETAIFAAGCFWHVQYLFDQTPGVISTSVGYTGCNKDYSGSEKITYKWVCNRATGCAEAVQVTFDPKKTSYGKLLEIFWKNHDPTTMNRQGPDVGSQYRSAVFYLDEKQKKEALAMRDKMQKALGKDKKIVTEITKAAKFFPAEEYHQKYYEKNKIFTCRI